MDLVRFIGLRVKVQLLNDYYFIGWVINADEQSLELKDLRGKIVGLSKQSILTIQECSR